MKQDGEVFIVIEDGAPVEVLDEQPGWCWPALGQTVYVANVNGGDTLPIDPDVAYTAAVDRARVMGAANGNDAATWVLDGSASVSTAARLYRGIEEGDPEVLDELPATNLSGEWAGTITADELMAECTMLDRDEVPVEVADWLLSEVCDAYDDGFTVAVTGAAQSRALDLLVTDLTERTLGRR